MIESVISKIDIVPEEVTPAAELIPEEASEEEAVFEASLEDESLEVPQGTGDACSQFCVGF